MNVMILGGKPMEAAYPPCQAGSELMERIGRLEACLDRLEEALALADRALDGAPSAQRKKPDTGDAPPAPRTAASKSRAAKSGIGKTGPGSKVSAKA